MKKLFFLVTFFLSTFSFASSRLSAAQGIVEYKVTKATYSSVHVKNASRAQLILNFDKSPVFIKIYDADDNEVYDSKQLTDQNVIKHFDLNPNFSDKYTFVMKYGDKVFVNTIASK